MVNYLAKRTFIATEQNKSDAVDCLWLLEPKTEKMTFVETNEFRIAGLNSPRPAHKTIYISSGATQKRTSSGIWNKSRQTKRNEISLFRRVGR